MMLVEIGAGDTGAGALGTTGVAFIHLAFFGSENKRSDDHIGREANQTDCVSNLKFEIDLADITIARTSTKIRVL